MAAVIMLACLIGIIESAMSSPARTIPDVAEIVLPVDELEIGNLRYVLCVGFDV